MEEIVNYTPTPDIGCCAMSKQNRSYEDRYAIAKIGDIQYYAVFDGHGGGNDKGYSLHPNHVVTYLEKNLHYRIADAFRTINLSDSNQIKKALTDVFIEVDHYLYNSNYVCGSTCTIILIINDKCYQVNLGDSRSLICNEYGTILSRTIDHKPKHEGSRIYSVGGTVSSDRVNGILAVSRSFGDFELKLINGRYSPHGPVSAIPDIYIYPFSTNLIFIMGSDGLFDGFSKNCSELVEILKYAPFDQSATTLINYVTGRNGNDDVTVIIVKNSK